jgi:MOSC domain-containing protein YiiM
MAFVKYININPQGGVPKFSTDKTYIGEEKVNGDKQNDLKHHGGTNRAVCLFSDEIITLLQKEGHPIKPGSTGENLTIKGLDWGVMKEGLVLSIGHIKLEITGPTSPCKTIAKSFKNDSFIRISEKINPGYSRWYAKVLKKGVIYRNDVVNIL